MKNILSKAWENPKTLIAAGVVSLGLAGVFGNSGSQQTTEENTRSTIGVLNFEHSLKSEAPTGADGGGKITVYDTAAARAETEANAKKATQFQPLQP